MTPRQATARVDTILGRCGIHTASVDPDSACIDVDCDLGHLTAALGSLPTLPAEERPDGTADVYALVENQPVHLHTTHRHPVPLAVIRRGTLTYDRSAS